MLMCLLWHAACLLGQQQHLCSPRTAQMASRACHTCSLLVYAGSEPLQDVTAQHFWQGWHVSGPPGPTLEAAMHVKPQKLQLGQQGMCTNHCDLTHMCNDSLAVLDGCRATCVLVSPGLLTGSCAVLPLVLFHWASAASNKLLSWAGLVHGACE